MAVGKRKKCRQGELFFCTHEIRSSSNPFYEAFNKLLCKNGFDAFVEDLYEPFYADGTGRPRIPPGVYFRMLLVGFLEGLESEREIVWRCCDSLTLRNFLGYEITESPRVTVRCSRREKSPP